MRLCGNTWLSEEGVSSGVPFALVSGRAGRAGVSALFASAQAADAHAQRSKLADVLRVAYAEFDTASAAALSAAAFTAAPSAAARDSCFRQSLSQSQCGCRGWQPAGS